MIEQKIKAYFGEYAVPGVVHAVQGDTGRVFIFESQDLQLTGDQTAALMCIRPNGTAFSYAGTIDTDAQTITVALDDDEGALTEAGVVAAQLVLQEDGQILCSFRLGIIVQEVLGGEATPEEKTFVAGLQAQLDAWIAAAAALYVPVTRKVNGNALSSDVTIQADAIPYDNTTSGLTGDDVQDALDELADEKLDTASATVNGKSLPAQLYVQDIPTKNIAYPSRGDYSGYGLTITLNDDGSWTVSGQATTAFSYGICEAKIVAGTEYTLTGCPSGGGVNSFQLGVSGGYGSDAGSGLTFTASTTTTATITLSIANGYQFASPITLYPMIRLATITDDTYVPYAKTNAELSVKTGVIQPTLTNVQTGGALFYWKSGNIVTVLFDVKMSGTGDKTICTLPVGFRPIRAIGGIIPNTTGAAVNQSYTIDTSGNVILNCGNTTNQLYTTIVFATA